MNMRLFGLAILSAAILAGCASTPRPPERTLGDAVSEAETPHGSAPAASVYPLRAARWVYDIVEGDQLGQTLVHARSRTDRFEAEWADAEDDRRTQFWRQEQNGDIVMTAVIEHDDRAITLFDPPLIIAFDSLARGETRRQEVAMRVVDERNPAQQRESGRATRSMEYVDDQRVTTPMGEFIARRILIRFEADLNLADAIKVTTMYVVDELGAVAEQRQENVRVLGAFGRSSDQTLELREVVEAD